MKSFWDDLPHPFYALAPLANVTDAAFRRVIAKYGKPDVMFTEFTSADGLISAGRENLLIDLMYSEGERPIVAQLFSGNPEKMYEAARVVQKLGFDGLDINMGCPDRSIERSGAGAALIKNPPMAREIIRAAKEGAAPLPVSVKTRLGYNKDTLEEWLPELLAERPAAITVHARTRKEMSKVPAHWDRVKRAVEIRDEFCRQRTDLACPPKLRRRRGSGEKSVPCQTLILGNGDVTSIAEAREKAEATGADGIMLGRAIFGKPWLFAVGGKRSDFEEPPIRDRLRIAVEHAKLFEQLLGKHKSFAILKKHFKAYVEGFEGAKELRLRLMETENAEQVESIVAGLPKDHTDHTMEQF